jgi:hypothetical protein
MQQSKNTFSSFKLIHKAMLLGQIIATSIFLILTITKLQTPLLVEQDRLFQIVALLFTAITFFVGNIIFKKKVAVIKSNINLTVQQQFEQYKTANLIQWALLEAATLFNGIAYFLIGNYSFIALAAVIILFFAMLAPNKTKMAIHLGISPQDLEDL